MEQGGSAPRGMAQKQQAGAQGEKADSGEACRDGRPEGSCNGSTLLLARSSFLPERVDQMSR